ncbi:MAG: hypothetical protein PHG85_03720 [Candidatus Altiarchaeota archaeon]|nr:hypothetical protein [Candidatus Altiarchaeota archaeon]
MDDDIFRWAELRVNRFIWLSHMAGMLEKARHGRRGAPDAYDEIANHLILLRHLALRMDKGSACPPTCGSLCCYFPGDYSAQVLVSEGERRALDSLLAETGERLEDHYTFVLVGGLDKRIREHVTGMPGFVHDMKGVPSVCVLNPSHRKVDRKLLSHKPRPPKLLDDMWTDETAKACRFLSEDNSCRLYRHLRFGVCHNYYCRTAFALLILRHYGLVGDETSGRPMNELNRLADDVAMAFRSNDLYGKEKEYDSLFRELAVFYATGNETKKACEKLKSFEKRYEKELMACLKSAAKKG